MSRLIAVIMLLVLCAWSCDYSTFINEPQKIPESSSPIKEENHPLSPDTLELRAYNPSDTIDLEKEFLPLFSQDYEVAITDKRYRKSRARFKKGLVRQTRYNFTFSNPDVLEQGTGLGNKFWSLQVDEYDTVNNAVLTFNNYIQEVSWIRAGLVENKKSEVNRFISGKTIYAVHGDCSSAGIVEKASKKLLAMKLDKDRWEWRSLTSIFCGGAAYAF